MDTHDLTIAEAAHRIEAREVSPVELTQAYLDRIDRLDPEINTFVTLTRERALDDAARAEADIAAGRYRGALHGIPVSIKDSLATAGVRTTAGAKHLSDWIPDEDATVVARLKEAGAVILGKTNMHEWAAGCTTINPYYGTTRNPWDRNRVSGGSSGGSAASVAAGLALGSIGTDNAGSVRNPASLCGVVGLKATYGRVSRVGGVAGTGGYSTDHFGVLTRTVRDSALMLQAIAGPDPKDPLSSDAPVPDFGALLGEGVAGLKVGIIRDYFDDLAVDEVKEVVADAVKLLESLGMSVQELPVPYMEHVPMVQLVTARAENLSPAEPFLRTRPRDYSPGLMNRQILALTLPAHAYVTAQRVRRLICEAFDRAFEQVDVIVSPAVSMPAETIEECEQGYVESAGGRILLSDARGTRGTLCTIPFNVTGAPAVSVPCGFSSQGLPIGLQIAAPHFQEPALLLVAHAYEQAAGWHGRRPPVGWEPAP
ncbi:MAG: amidase [Deltaproteobacteria bacterium]|nr:amidase [Deltaproteobacteria bacterium]